MSSSIPSFFATVVPAERGRLTPTGVYSTGAFLLPGEYLSYVTITLTGLKNPTEVRVFEAGTTNEISGTGSESVTGGSHAFQIGQGQEVDISILSLGYQNLRILDYSSSASVPIPIQQQLDRQYENP